MGLYLRHDFLYFICRERSGADMKTYRIIIERTRDSQRFTRDLLADSERQAVRDANVMLAADPDDYYVVAVTTKRFWHI